MCAARAFQDPWVPARAHPGAVTVPPALVVFNDSAGNADRRTFDAALEVAFGPGAAVLAFDGDQDATERLDQAIADAIEADTHLIVAAGGDGTFSLLANRILRAGAGGDVRLAIVPIGTANVLARELGIPLDTAEALKLAAAGEETLTLDAIRCEDSWFFTQVGVGLDARMIGGTSRDSQVARGRLAYLVALATRVLGHRSNQFRLELDGRPIRLQAGQLVIANAATLGTPPLTWGPDIDPTDGVLNLCVYDLHTIWDFLVLLVRAILGHHKRDPRARFLRFRRKLVIRSRTPWPVQGDGEPLGRTPVELNVAPAAVRVVIPGPADPEAEPAAAKPMARVSRIARFRIAARRVMRQIRALDAEVFLALNRMRRYDAVDGVMTGASRILDHGEGWIVTALVIAFIQPVFGLSRAVETIAALWLTMLTVNYPLKALFVRHRPFITHESSRVVGRMPSDSSFPSGHSAAATAGALLLAPHAPAMAPAFGAYAALVCFSRVYLGVHYPSDVLMGIAMGAVLSTGWITLLQRLIPG